MKINNIEKLVSNEELLYFTSLYTSCKEVLIEKNTKKILLENEKNNNLKLYNILILSPIISLLYFFNMHYVALTILIMPIIYYSYIRLKIHSYKKEIKNFDKSFLNKAISYELKIKLKDYDFFIYLISKYKNKFLMLKNIRNEYLIYMSLRYSAEIGQYEYKCPIFNSL